MAKNLKIERIKKVFKKIFPKQKINKNFTNLQIGSIHEWDSLRNLNLILEIEKEFKFKFQFKFFECLLFEETISKPLKADIYQSLASFITSVMEEEGGEVGLQ